MYKFRNTIIGVLTVIGASIVLSACSGDKNKEPAEKQLRPVRTLTVEKADKSQTHEFTAVVDASKKADLSFKIAGEIIEFPINQGDNVKKGQVIAKLNDTDIKIQLDEARSGYDKAKADFTRAERLIKSNNISQSDFDQLKAQFNSAKAKLEGAENNLVYTELKASFDGVIAKKYTETFQEVNAKQAIVALHNLKKISLKVDVPESIMIGVRQNNAPPEIKASFDGVPGKEFPLTFKEVATQPDDVTKTYEVTFTMDSPKEHTILPGMTARVRGEKILANDSGAEYFLPPNVVLKDSNGHYVFVVEKESDGIGKVSRKTVTIGDINQLGIEVYAGIIEGEQVLSAGMSKVTDGMLVKF